MWRGGGRGNAGLGAGEVGAGESFFYMNPNLKKFLAGGRGGGGIWLG